MKTLQEKLWDVLVKVLATLTMIFFIGIASVIMIGIAILTVTAGITVIDCFVNGNYIDMIMPLLWCIFALGVGGYIIGTM